MESVGQFENYFWRRIFTFAAKVTLQINDEGLSIRTMGQSREIAFEPALCLHAKNHWWGARLCLSGAEKEILNLRGFYPGDAARATEIFEIKKKRSVRIAVLAIEPELRRLAAEGKALIEAAKYLRASEWSKWQGRAAAIKWLNSIPTRSPLLPEGLEKDHETFVGLFRLGKKEIGERNHRFVEEERKRHRRLMVNAKNQALTEEQQRAIIVDEDNTLVVASAGSGKTSVIEAKYRYLVETGKAKPAEILLLAYNAKSAQEIKQRIGLPEADASTFHAFGLRVLSTALDKSQSVSPIAENPEAFMAFIQAEIEEQLDVRTKGLGMIRFLANLCYPPLDDLAFTSSGEYVKAMKAAAYRTILGEKVKSYGELAIANFLMVHGIPYRYEALYPVAGTNKRKKAYKPDFQILGESFGLKDVYIEYFGIDKKGNTRKDIAPDKYREEMEWKKQQHKANGTQLMDLYYHQLREGALESELSSRLKEFGYPVEPLSAGQLKTALESKTGYISKLAELLATFIRLFKGGTVSLAELAVREASSESSWEKGQREAAFLKIFEAIFVAYEKELARTGEIDFEDMIRKSASQVREGGFKSPYRFVLVDEFQDISPGRAELVTALRDQVEGAALMCVGDDWQSIYRFAGSQIGLMTNFPEVFGATERVDLTLTHRFSQELALASTRFITSNPQQLRKAVESKMKTGKASIHIIFEDRPGSELEAAIRLLKAHLQGGRILILGRYYFLKPESLAGLGRTHPGFEFEFLSIHRSKGLEYDGVILLAVNQGYPSFPSNRADDPLFELLLGAADSYPNGEERRLFYVAMTRSKGPIIITTSEQDPSPFVRELMAPPYGAWVIHPGQADRKTCPRCSEGILVVRKNPQGSSFFGCSSYPYCDFTENPCAKCGQGYFGLDPSRPGTFACSTKGCGNTATQCTRCGGGWMRLIPGVQGRYRSFWGCTNYPECDFTYNQS